MKPLWGFFKELLLPVILVVIGIVGVLFGALLMGLDVLWGVVQSIVALVVALLTWDWETFKDQMKEIWSSVAEDVLALGDLFFGTMWSAITGLAAKLFSWEWGGQDTQEPTNVVGGFGEAAPPGATNITPTGFTALGGQNISYAAGTTHVPKDGLAYLHEGESVTQRGASTSNGGFTIGNINLYSYGKEDPESFGERTYRYIMSRMSEEREAVAHV